MIRTIRVSLVDYVNAWPLTWGILRGAVEGFEHITDVPAMCAERLRKGEAEAGLIPSVEAARIPGIRIVRGLGIASRERVRSVLLASRVPFEKITRVGLDVSSRSSAAMVQVLLKDLFDITPEFKFAVPDLPEMLRHYDAALVIGDRALTSDLSSFEVLDLAEAWHSLTGKPFVFAVWAVRPSVQPEPFMWSRDFGRRRIDEIVREATKRTRVGESVLREYLQGNLHHDLDKDDEDGLAEFFRRAARHGLIPSPDLPPFAEVPLVPRFEE
ncbi:MAG: menaquinone biosynthesis protein [Acidobacteria bacterium]|nr:menaquinone biosynthesis protein [Acidobacteriota bacterium]MCK6682948.1 menaquinone biosynthesis protein [Thermoanaerobaculia bacterium]